jgi:predicted secreted protein
LQDGTISINMHMDTTGMGLIQTAFADADPVAFVFRPGALSTADAGQWAGNCIVTDITMNGAVDDNWNVSLAAQITGTVTYTPAA